MSGAPLPLGKPRPRRLGAVRYMGNKLAFLDEVLAAAAELAEEGTTLVDPMAGSHAVTYAMKERHVILSSDALRMIRAGDSKATAVRIGRVSEPAPDHSSPARSMRPNSSP